MPSAVTVFADRLWLGGWLNFRRYPPKEILPGSCHLILRYLFSKNKRSGCRSRRGLTSDATKLFLFYGATVALIAGSVTAEGHETANIYIGAIRGADMLASSSDLSKLMAYPATSFYLTSYALTENRVLNLAAVLVNWRDHQPGILEVGTDPELMPDIVSQYGRYIKPGNRWTWGLKPGVGWPALIAAARWKPQYVMLNAFNMRHGAGDPDQDPYYRMNLMAIADVRAAAPSVKRVLPYLTANYALDEAKGADSWSSPYWLECRTLAIKAGGLGLDMPANYFSKMRGADYRNLAVEQIRWAKMHHLVSNVLLSIWAMKPIPGLPAQFGHDDRFVEAVQEVITFLHAQHADPSFYSIVNYSQGSTSNLPGPDTEHETLGSAALWAASRVATSR